MLLRFVFGRELWASKVSTVATLQVVEGVEERYLVFEANTEPLNPNLDAIQYIRIPPQHSP